MITFVATLVAALAAAFGSTTAQPYHLETGPARAPGAMLVFHGGGWIDTGAWTVKQMRYWASQYDDRYLTDRVDYRPSGPESVQDALAAYDRLRAQVGPRTPICTQGVSVGGYLALMVAARRDVACAVSEDGPTLLRAAHGKLRGLVEGAFGSGASVYDAYSPALLTRDMTAPVLLTQERRDPVVGVGQATAFARRYARAHLITLPVGNTMHVHSRVKAAAMRASLAYERRFIDRAMRAWRVRHAAGKPAG